MEINEELAFRIALQHLGYEIVIKSQEIIVNGTSFHPHTSFKIIYNSICPQPKIPNTEYAEYKELKKAPSEKSKLRRESKKEFETSFNPSKSSSRPSEMSLGSKAKLTKTQKRRDQRNRQKARLIEKGVRCHYCDAWLTEETFSWDHIVPKVSGGGNNKKNKIPACKQCNNDKSDKPYEAFTSKPLPVEYIQ